MIGSEEGSYLGLIDSHITQLKARGSSRACNESQEEGNRRRSFGCRIKPGIFPPAASCFGCRVNLGKIEGYVNQFAPRQALKSIV